MLINKKIKQKLEQLVSLHLMKGLQPSEIADAIFEKDYSDIKMSKVLDNVHLIASFREELDGEIVQHKMRYTYEQNKKLILVEQKVGNKAYREQWSREEKITSIISTLSKQLKELNCPKSVDELLMSIPIELRGQIQGKVLSLVA